MAAVAAPGGSALLLPLDPLCSGPIAAQAEPPLQSGRPTSFGASGTKPMGSLGELNGRSCQRGGSPKTLGSEDFPGVRIDQHCK